MIVFSSKNVPESTKKIDGKSGGKVENAARVESAKTRKSVVRVIKISVGVPQEKITQDPKNPSKHPQKKGKNTRRNQRFFD